MVAAPDTAGRIPNLPRPNWHALELGFWATPLLAYFVAPDRRLLLVQIFVYALFALSLDLILGYAGILSLGHAAFFGTGAYTAGLLARHGWVEPLSGLGAAALICAAFGYAVSFLVVSGPDLTRLLVTLGVGLLTSEVANQASAITGGVDGLSDMQPARLLGVFAFQLNGKTAFVYSLIVLLLVFVFVRRLVQAPFGLSLRGIRENRRRMAAIGVNVRGRLQAIFALGAAIAGMAGALLAQTTGFVGIDTLSFQRSADLLIILLIGGTGRLYGALLGAAVFILAQDYLSGISPEYWQFWLGAALVLFVLVAPGGLIGGGEASYRRWRHRWQVR
jgi:branched-chain amino acid transport system permease protein